MGSPLFETVKRAFSGENWAFSEVTGREVIEAGFEAKNGRVELHAQVFPEIRAISIVSESIHETGDHPARRDRLAELAMRANRSLTVGNFELDWESGKLLFRVTNLFSDEAGDPKIILGLIRSTVTEMDWLMPAVAAIARLDGAELAGLDLVGFLQSTADSERHS